jgi:hypothetical protein
MYFPFVNGDADNSHLHFCEATTPDYSSSLFCCPRKCCIGKKRHSNCPL